VSAATRASAVSVPGANIHYEMRGAGPVLLMVQGGDGDAGGTAGIADQLVSDFTVVTYDRRGLSRSALDARAPSPTVATHADDVHRLLEAIATEPSFVFGASIGALIGLELVSRHTNQVRMLVAHEPPTTQFLPDAEREQGLRSQLDVEEAFRQEGIVGAMRKFVAVAGLNFDDREADVKLPAPGPRRMANLSFFLTHDVPAVRVHKLDAECLRAASAQLVLGVGRTSGEYLPARCVKAVARSIGREPIEFPGGHNGFVTDPRAFAGRLRDVFTGKTAGAKR
jgi:pimeloyl-ACP methyl ester carboxylesterase